MKIIEIGLKEKSVTMIDKDYIVLNESIEDLREISEIGRHIIFKFGISTYVITVSDIDATELNTFRNIMMDRLLNKVMS
jgi:hypothetical protein